MQFCNNIFVDLQHKQMKIKVEQLKTYVQNLKPIYIITGDEPLLNEEVSQYINKIARNQGFIERKFIQANSHFNWQEFTEMAQSLSLFSEKKILELSLENGKPGKLGSIVLTKYAQNPLKNNLLILRLPKLPTISQKSKWFTALEQVGIVINIWPIKAEQFPSWLERRLSRAKLHTSKAGLNLLASLSTGNLLAAKQNIEKLALLYNEGEITAKQIENCLNDNSTYDVYTLLNSSLAMDVKQTLRILQYLQKSNIEVTLILWVFTKELRLLAKLAKAITQGEMLSHLWQQHGVWSQRQTLLTTHLNKTTYSQYLALLQLAAHCDRLVKGIELGNIWACLNELILKICKVELLNL